MEFEIWNYPHVDSLTIQQHQNPESETCADTTAQEPALSEEQQRQQDEHNARMQELTEHIQAIKEIRQQLLTHLHQVNETFLTDVVQLIKSITERVIHQELQMDDTRITHMITQALAEIQNDAEACTVYMAPEQLAYFTQHVQMPPEVTLQEDSSLKKGDFRIKTIYSELESILEKRLNELFNLKNL